MNEPAEPQPLSDDELQLLDDLLQQADPESMTVEMVDGFFAALISGPDPVLPDEYLPEIWGDAPAFENEEVAEDAIQLLMRHWNTIASELLRTLREDHVYEPVLFEDDEGIAHGNDWAHGFMTGVEMRLENWQELLDSEEFGGALTPILMLAQEDNPDPKLRPPKITADEREDLIADLVEGVAFIYQYFAPQRAAAVPQTPIRRDSPKVGRNDPCPCGSGRKYKQCCGAGGTTVH
jgi:uncharacterized protein